MERTFMMVKPDGVQRELIGEIITRFEKKGVKIVGMKLMMIDENLAKKHYEAHLEKSFFPELLKFITSGPVVAMVLEGENIIDVVRRMAGSTSPKEAQPGTIRGDYILDIGHNIIHTSDSKENAEREINLFFSSSEIIDYNLADRPWIYTIDINE